LRQSPAVSNFGIYEIKIKGILHKIGKADLDRIVQSTQLPNRLHAQLRKLKQLYGDNNVVGRVMEKLGRVTTLEAKMAETARLQRCFDKFNTIPKGNEKSFIPKL
jgi:hypothetical protein